MPIERTKPVDFLVAICPVCRVPWPTCDREDLRLAPHSREARTEGERRLGRRSPAGLVLVICEGTGQMLARQEYGENGEERFHPPAEPKEFCTCGIYPDGPPSVPDPRTAWRHKSFCRHSSAKRPN